MKIASRRSCWAVVAVVVLCACRLFSQSDDLLARARALAVAGKLAESQGILHDYLQAHPSSADAHFLLGYVLFREQKARESLAEFTAGARNRRPGSDDFRIIASDYVLLGDFADAAKWFSEVAVETPEDPEAWYLLGRAQYSEDHFTDAIASFQHALKLRPQYIEAENNLGLAWQGLNASAQASTAFSAAIQWQNDHPVDPQPYLNLGSLLIDQNQPERALPYLQVAAGLAPENPKIHEELGRAYENREDLPRAQSELEKAIALAPSVSALHFKLGRVYRSEGFRDRAQQQFAICARLDSSHSSKNTPNPFSQK